MVHNDNTRNPDGTLKESPDSPVSSSGLESDRDGDRDEDSDEEMTDYGSVSPAEPMPNVFITEMLENGDLSVFIKAVRQHGETIPNPILWRFLLCCKFHALRSWQNVLPEVKLKDCSVNIVTIVVRMCIGLAYPPAEIEELKRKPAPVTEKIPTRLRDKPSRIVHFDIDTKNSMLYPRLCQGSDY